MPTYEYSCQKCGKTFEVFQLDERRAAEKNLRMQ